MFKIREMDKQVFVNEEKRTCVVKVDYEIFLERYPYEAMVGNYEYVTVVGKAKCLPEDQFDKVKGLRIAESKAMLKAINVAEKRMNEYILELKQYTSGLIAAYDKLSTMKAVEEESIIRNGSKN
jgi:hypothetical protein